MRMKLAILLCKLAHGLLLRIGRGSSLPGVIALKICPDILGRIRMPKTVIAVTGSNGKTSTTALIATAARKAGLRVVCNAEGSNQTEGVVTALLIACDKTGTVEGDCAVLESDERFCQYTFRRFSPDAIVVTNLVRDQLTRNGHNEFVKRELMKGLPAESTLILNADDPLTASLAAGRTHVFWFGVSENAFREPEGTYHAYDDGAFCPCCCGRMQYDARVQSHFGSYRCGNCGFCRPIPDHCVSARYDNTFEFDGLYDTVPQIPNEMYASNLAAAFTVCCEILKLPPEDAAAGLSHITLSNQLQDRVHRYDYGSGSCTLLLTKHENSIAYNATLTSLVRDGQERFSVAVIVNKLSRKYIATDLSWIWDIDFELLAECGRIDRILLGGSFAYDLASRCAFAGVDPARIYVNPSVEETVAELTQRTDGTAYLLTCFTDAPGVQKLLKKTTVKGEQA